MKKIAVFLPDLPQKSYIRPLEQSLSFLSSDYLLDFIDPNDLNEELDNAIFYQCWREQVKKMLPHYDAFLGFSFGGVILQQCLSLFVAIKKPIILFSTPAYANEALRQKLGEVITLCKQHHLEAALKHLYQFVNSPYQLRNKLGAIKNKEDAETRMISGLQRVLETDSRAILQTTAVHHVHLIGQYSALVNDENTIAPKAGRLIVVPQAGMRVLQDNLLYCKAIILTEFAHGA